MSFGCSISLAAGYVRTLPSRSPSCCERAAGARTFCRSSLWTSASRRHRHSRRRSAQQARGEAAAWRASLRVSVEEWPQVDGPPRGLELLLLSRNRLGDEGARTLAHALDTEKWLRVLDLRLNSIGEAGRTALAEPLCKTPSSARGHRPNCPSGPSEGLGLACSNTRTRTHTHQPQYEYAYE